MTRKFGTVFSVGWSCLKLQMESLFDEAGGAEALQLLDLLAEMPESEKRAALTAFGRVAKQLSERPAPDRKDDDCDTEDLGESIYRDIMKELRSEFAPAERKRSLQLMEGGKAKEGPKDRHVQPKKEGRILN